MTTVTADEGPPKVAIQISTIMPKTKKSQPKAKAAKTKAPKGPKAARQAKVGASRAYTSLVKQACSLTNPFCVEAVGARIPDDSYTKSVGWSATNIAVSIAANVNGERSVFFSSNPYANYNLGTVPTTNSATAAVNMAPVGSPPATLSAGVQPLGVSRSAQPLPL